MVLVDYSSDGSSSPPSPSEVGPPPKADSSPPAKRRKTATPTTRSRTAADTTNEPGTGPVVVNSETGLPPLPDAFHDLYAHTVRTSNVDDPALHQGRRRLVPHQAGNWPSHLYIEWHPSQNQYDSLSLLVSEIKNSLEGEDDDKLIPLLTSDLGAPLPLHISLSRPLSLTTSNKNAFLGDIRQAITGCGISPFRVHFDALDWHRTEESGRTFLVLRIKSDTPTSTHENWELMRILSKANSIVKEYDEIPLYANRDEDKMASAFHISIGWTASPITDSMTETSATTFSKAKDLKELTIRVDGIKVKIGNTVTNLALSPVDAGSQKSNSSLLGLF